MIHLIHNRIDHFWCYLSLGRFFDLRLFARHFGFQVNIALDGNNLLQDFELSSHSLGQFIQFSVERRVYTKDHDAAGGLG